MVVGRGQTKGRRGRERDGPDGEREGEERERTPQMFKINEPLVLST